MTQTHDDQQTKEAFQEREETPLVFTPRDVAIHASALLDVLDEGVFAIDSEWRYTYLNRKAEELIGKSGESLLGQIVWEVFPDAIETLQHQHVLQAIADKRTVHAETYISSLEKWFDSSIYPSHDGIVIIAQDVTERKRLEREKEMLLVREQQARAEVEEERARLEALFLQAPALVTIQEGPEHIFTLVHPLTKQLLENRELLGKPVREAVPYMQGQGYFERLDEVYSTGKTYMGKEVLARIKQEDGSIKEAFFNFTYLPTFDTQGQVQGVMTFAVEVTEQVRARRKAEELAGQLLVDITRREEVEESLKHSEQNFRNLAETIPQLVWVVTPEGDHEYFNQHWYEYACLTFEQSRRRGWSLVLHPDDFERTLALWQTAMSTGTLFETEYRIRNGKTGEYRWFIGRALPIRDDQGKMLKWFGTCTDINDWKALEQRKDEFMSMASHELKTPITTIKVLTQVMKRTFQKQGSTEPVAHLTKMETQINKLTKLISDLLDVSKIGADKLDYAEEPVALDALIRDVVEMIQQTDTSHTLRLYGKTDAFVNGDSDRLMQVFINLINNAIKYSPRATDVDITLREVDDMVSIMIRDYGVGIPGQHLDKIFERFYRVYDGKNKAFPGLGMGLYISYEIVKRHGGDITVVSEEGKGSTFTVTLPIQ